MKKFSKLAVILTALAVSLMLTACPHSGNGGNSSGSSSGGTTAFEGTYSGELTYSEGDDPFEFSITVDSTGMSSFSWMSTYF